MQDAPSIAEFHDQDLEDEALDRMRDGKLCFGPLCACS
jgi:hypothetical protein